MLTCAAELSKAKIQQPQLIPSFVTMFAQHDVAACDVHVCQGASHMEAVHCLHNTSAVHQQNARLDVGKACCMTYINKLHSHLQHLLLILLNGKCLCSAWWAELTQGAVQCDAFYKPAHDLERSTAVPHSQCLQQPNAHLLQLEKKTYSSIMRASPCGKPMSSLNLTTRGMCERLA